MQFTQGLHRAAQQQPDAIATACGPRQQTFRELKDRVARLAGGLQGMGIKSGDRIAIYALNSDRYLEFYLAGAWLGAVVNPVNFRWSPAEVIYSLNDSQSSLLFMDDQFAPHADAVRQGAECVKQFVFCGDGDLPDGMASHEQLIANSQPIADCEAGDDTLFGVFYTGGTTGAPKGVMLSHRAVCTSALSLLADGAVPEGAVALHAAPMFHLADMMLITCLLLRGGQHVMLPVFRPDTVLDLVQTHRISDLLLVPAMLQAVVDFPGLAQADTSPIKRIMYGASPASEALLDRTLKNIPTTQLMQVYGMTETAAVIAVLPFAMHQPGQPREKLRSGGRAAFHTQVRIVDDNAVEKPQGDVGEIIVKTPALMQGYLNKPEATAAAVKNGWMHTGDMGYIDADGYIYVVDRLKDMIISGGENVYSSEVENAIAKHPAVAASAVIGIPSDEWGEAVHAVVVLKPDTTLTHDDLYAHCKTLIAGYKCPRSMEVVNALPVSGAGKVLKIELRKPHWEGKGRAVN